MAGIISPVNPYIADPVGTQFLPETAKYQPSLIEAGQSARQASVDAMTAPRMPLLRAIADWVHRRGRLGATRDEVATALCRPIQSVCRPILALLQDGELVDTRRRRLTQWGCEATVFVHRDYVGDDTIFRAPIDAETQP